MTPRKVTVRMLMRSLAVFDKDMEVVVECEHERTAGHILLDSPTAKVVERDGLTSAALVLRIHRDYVNLKDYPEPEDDPSVAHEAPVEGGY